MDPFFDGTVYNNEASTRAQHNGEHWTLPTPIMSLGYFNGCVQSNNSCHLATTTLHERSVVGHSVDADTSNDA
jgi:hypothetical protein